MPTLLLRFPAGRYHATAWGHHVNEGLIEWPPSPWRLLRALLAAGYSKMHWPAAGPPDVARRLIEKLASVQPAYKLPAATGAHSRHYMPMARFKDGREETTLVFDTWARVADGEVAVRWQVELDADERAELVRLAAALDYLGRSESWVDARVADRDEAEETFDVRPSEAHAQRFVARPGWEQVSVLVPLPADRYAAWRAAEVGAALNALPTKTAAGKPTPASARRKKSDEVERTYPTDLMACLQVDTAWLRECGWSQPPGSRRVLYWRRIASLGVVPAPSRPREALRADPVGFMLLALASASGRSNVLPRMERALPQAELLHRALVARAHRLHGHSPVLSGCDEHGRPVGGPHRHAHLLHLDLDADGCLDHVLVWAPMGLDADAQAAVRAVRKTFTKGGIEPLRLVVAGAGSDWSGIRDMPAPLGDAMRSVVGTSRQWVSCVPFVPPRHLKARGSNSLEGQLRAELASRGLPAPRTVVLLDPRVDDRARQHRHHVRVRRMGPPPPVDMGFTLRIAFDEPVEGPLCLGYGSHFGLGRFIHCEPQSD